MTTFCQNTPDIERYSPPEIVAAAREALGSIDYDPCTTPLVNGTFIRASHFYTKETDGLNRNNPWAGRIYINPPGGGMGGNKGGNGPRAFWNRLIVEYEAKRVSAAIYLAYDIEHLQQNQNWSHVPMLSCPFCIPAKRLTFWREKDGRLEPRDHNEFANAIIYLGKNVKRFCKAFADIGIVVIPRIANVKPVSGHGDPAWNSNPTQTGTTDTAHTVEEKLKRPSTHTPEHYGIHCAVDPDPNVDTPLQDPYPKGTDEACRIATEVEEKLATTDSLRKKGHTITWDCPICKGLPRQTRCVYAKAIAQANRIDREVSEATGVYPSTETTDDLEPTSGD